MVRIFLIPDSQSWGNAGRWLDGGKGGDSSAALEAGKPTSQQGIVGQQQRMQRPWRKIEATSSTHGQWVEEPRAKIRRRRDCFHTATEQWLKLKFWQADGSLECIQGSLEDHFGCLRFI